MNATFLSVLGAGAHAARTIGLGTPLRVSRDVVDYAFLRAERPPLKAKLHNLELRGYLRHRSFLDSLAGGGYEAYSRELYLRALQRGVTVIDGGAHIGFYTLTASRWISRSGQIFAFEPDPYNFQALSFNVRKSAPANITLLPQALSQAVGKACFYQNPGTTGSSLIDRRGVGPCRRAEAEVTTVDHILRDQSVDCLVVKLDLEGAEPLALHGMKHSLRRSATATLLMEVNPSALDDGGFTFGDIVRELAEVRMRVFYVDERNRTLEPVTTHMTPRKGNLYCRKEG